MSIQGPHQLAFVQKRIRQHATGRNATTQIVHCSVGKAVQDTGKRYSIKQITCESCSSAQLL